MCLSVSKTKNKLIKKMSCGLINLIFFLEFWCKILLLCGYTILLPILVPNSYSLFLLRIAIMLEVKTLSILSKFGQRQKKKNHFSLVERVQSQSHKIIWKDLRSQNNDYFSF